MPFFCFASPRPPREPRSVAGKSERRPSFEDRDRVVRTGQEERERERSLKCTPTNREAAAASSNSLACRAQRDKRKHPPAQVTEARADTNIHCERRAKAALCVCVCEASSSEMAGGSAKKLARDNNARLDLLRKAILVSEFLHIVCVVGKTRSLSPAALHDTRSWLFLGGINAFAWFAFNFLSKFARSGTSLTPATVRGGGGAAWWIENLQDLIFLISGTNFFTVFSMRMGVALLGLVS